MTAGPLAPDEQEVAGAFARAAIYRLLGGAFAYPTIARLEELPRMAEAVAAAPPTPAELVEALCGFEQAARTSDPGAVADEYVFLFDRQVRCSPYEGAYNGAAQMAGKAAQMADIAGFYAAFGLEPAGGQPDLEDHIAAELEFMSALALKEAYALAEANAEGLEVTRRAQTAFMADHLGRWAETFAAEIAEATPLPYYTAAAALLAAWIPVEIERLGAAPPRLEALAAPDPGDEQGFTCPMALPESDPEAAEPS